jgi:pyruvate dehydrogenase complex dehydrogenase (E1) component
LACVWGLGQRLTYFVEDLGEKAAEPGVDPRLLVLTTNPFDLVFVNMEHRDLFAPNQTIEQRIRLVAPFVTIAQKLCDQPPGSAIGPAEL